ncbi:MAG TPA: NnrU family protein, partial [Steroidobacter sp.]|nr:NnrU family protein [Steroidobacter sp.]
MSCFVLGLIAFLGMHSVSIAAPGWRDATAARIGENSWKGLYSLVSIAGLALLIWGYGVARADPMVLYTPPAWTRWLSAILMAPVFPLLLATYVPGRIKAALQHPMLAAVKFWALAHLIANGTLPDVLLFGGFLAWAIADRISLKRRTQRPIRTAPVTGWNDAIAVVVGLALYFVV